MDPVTQAAPEPIPLVDLRAQYAAIGAEIRAAIEEVLEQQQFILGPQVAALEQEIADLCGRRFGIGVASGTDALVLGLRVCGIGPGDDVVVPAFTFVAGAGAVSQLGARPVFADINAATFNLDPGKIESRITAKTRGIIAVHLFGLPADMHPILELAARRKLTVVEDNAQALGARYHGRRSGSMGALGCVSFYPSKNLGAYGDAGMIVTDDEEMAARLRWLRNHGQSGRYVSAEPGWNSRLDELQAAILRVKLRYLERWNAARRAHAARYTALLERVAGVVTPAVPAGCEHVFHQYTIRIEGAAAPRDCVREFLAKQGIASAVYYPVPLHLQPLYAGLGYKRGELPAAERAAEQLLSLPMYPELTANQIERVANAVTNALKT